MTVAAAVQVGSDVMGDQGVVSEGMTVGEILEEVEGVAAASDQGVAIDMEARREVVQDAKTASGVQGAVTAREALAQVRVEIDSVHAALKADADSKLHIQIHT